jgi:hypothetical protein
MDDRLVGAPADCHLVEQFDGAVETFWVLQLGQPEQQLRPRGAWRQIVAGEGVGVGGCAHAGVIFEFSLACKKMYFNPKLSTIQEIVLFSIALCSIGFLRGEELSWRK